MVFRWENLSRPVGHRVARNPSVWPDLLEIAGRGTEGARSRKLPIL